MSSGGKRGRGARGLGMSHWLVRMDVPTTLVLTAGLWSVHVCLQQGTHAGSHTRTGRKPLAHRRVSGSSKGAKPTGCVGGERAAARLGLA